VVRQRSAKPLSAGSIPAVASNSVALRTPPAFSYVSTVESHGWFKLAPFRWDGRVLARPEVIDGRVVDVEITWRPGSIRAAWKAPEQPPASRRYMRARITRMLQLDVDTSEFIALARQSPAHTFVVQRSFGRLLCGSTLFEDIVKIIATTNTRWSQTKRMVQLLVEKCGRKSPAGHFAFPSAEDIARFSADELQRDCRLGYRANTIHQLATGGYDLAAIADASQTTEELFAAYKSLPGIGPYGAAHLLAMDGRHDFIAVDTEFRRFVREKYYGGRKVTDRAMLRKYSKWGRWKYLAYWSELWASVADALHSAEGEDR
jgi:3-methyladenine DNA glycosylase/8-oxoguanine DNA glycosylase